MTWYLLILLYHRLSTENLFNNTYNNNNDNTTINKSAIPTRFVQRDLHPPLSITSPFSLLATRYSACPCLAQGLAVANH